MIHPRPHNLTARVTRCFITIDTEQELRGCSTYPAARRNLNEILRVMIRLQPHRTTTRWGHAGELGKRESKTALLVLDSTGTMPG